MRDTIETPAPEQVARLPRWAKAYITRLERRVAHDSDVIDELKGTDPREPIAVRDPYGESVPVAWDHTDNVRYYPDGFADKNTWIEVRMREAGSIEVFGSKGLTIRPEVTNVVRIATDR